MLSEFPFNKAISSHLPKEGIALYIHWPFCLSKCPYCDFNSHVTKSIPQKRFAQALQRELLYHVELLGPRYLHSIYFGGGTPSLMLPETVKTLIDLASQYFIPSPNLEITLEANPTSIEINRLAAFKAAGINRVSLGIQSLDSTALKLLGRQHSVAQALEALNLAKQLFHNVSFDLIYAREGQNLSQWKNELQQALSLVSHHLSLYQLTIEEGTVFAKRYHQGLLHLPDTDTQVKMQYLTQEITANYGLDDYEVSNYARPGLESQHNLAYWRYQDYIGIGPGAHGRISYSNQLYATECIKNPMEWINKVEKQEHGIVNKESLSPLDKAREMLLMGLRLKEGVSAYTFEQRCGISLIESIVPSVLSTAIEAGYLCWNQKVLKTTLEGRLRLNALLEVLLR